MLKLAGKTKGAVISCNVSYKDRIDAETLVAILSGKLSPEARWLSHIDTFFNELPREYILGVMKENGLSLGRMAETFHSLPSVLQGKNFKALLHETQ